MSTESIVVSNNPISSWETFNITLTPRRFKNEKMSHREIGGFYSARFDIETHDREEAIAWINNAPGRHVEFYSEKGICDWEGQIRSVKFDTGIATLENDLRNMANSAFARYQPVGGGATVRSATVENQVSIDRWGKKVWVLAAGEVAGAVANQRAQIFLDESFWAKPQLLSLNQAGKLKPLISVSFICVGYWQLLDYSIYNQTVILGEANASTVVGQVIADADVGQFIVSSSVEPNVTQVTQEFDADRKPTSIIEGICSLGDAAFNPFVAGFESGRHFYYRQGAASS